MTDYLSPQGYGLSAPSSRQDIVSALLSEYGNSFGRGDGSPSNYSPVPADKELPPPPPRSDSLRNKPLPAVQRAEQRMSMKFQLRGKRICRMHLIVVKTLVQLGVCSFAAMLCGVLARCRRFPFHVSALIAGLLPLLFPFSPSPHRIRKCSIST